jgi:hypothetical protein
METEFLDELNRIYTDVGEQLNRVKYDAKELSQIIDDLFKPTDIQKKNYAEISTPRILRQEMLDKVPLDFWNSPKKVFEPSAGKGGFVLDVVDRFMNGDWGESKEETPEDAKEVKYKHIVEQCIYFSDIDPFNIYIVKLLLDPDNKYQLNYNVGDTLKLDVSSKWGMTQGFDMVVGNPPFNDATGNKGVGHNIWKKFVTKALSGGWMKPQGYLLFIHPKGWRQIDDKLGKLIKEKQLLYLNMNNLKMGMKIFNCSTDFDWYLLENIDIYTTTLIVDYLGETYELDLNGKTFIPNHSMIETYNIIDEKDTCKLIYSSSIYEPRKKIMSKFENGEFKYPCIYSINKNNDISFRWSSRNDLGHFGVSKLIFSNGMGFIHDVDGLYGLTQWAYALPCSGEAMKELELVFKNSIGLLNIFDAIKLTSEKYNYKILKHFKKDFWKDY